VVRLQAEQSPQSGPLSPGQQPPNGPEGAPQRLRADWLLPAEASESPAQPEAVASTAEGFVNSHGWPLASGVSGGRLAVNGSNLVLALDWARLNETHSLELKCAATNQLGSSGHSQAFKLEPKGAGKCRLSPIGGRSNGAHLAPTIDSSTVTRGAPFGRLRNGLAQSFLGSLGQSWLACQLAN